MFLFLKEVGEGILAIIAVLVVIGLIIIAPILGAIAFFVTLFIVCLVSVRAYQLDRRDSLKKDNGRVYTEGE